MSFEKWHEALTSDCPRPNPYAAISQLGCLGWESEIFLWWSAFFSCVNRNQLWLPWGGEGHRMDWKAPVPDLRRGQRLSSSECSPVLASALFHAGQGLQGSPASWTSGQERRVLWPSVSSVREGSSRKQSWIVASASEPQFQFSHSVMFDSATPWTAAQQASLSITSSWSLLRLMSIEPVMPSSHLIFCRPLLLLPSIFPSIRIFSNESVLRIRWPEYWSFSFPISPSPVSPKGLISFRIDWFEFQFIHLKNGDSDTCLAEVYLV